MRSIIDWFKGAGRATSTRVVAVYLIGIVLLALGWAAGVIGPIVKSGGWVAGVIGLIAAVHAWGAIKTSMALDRTKLSWVDYPETDFEKARARLAWLEKADVSILALGFLGKLYGIAQVTGGALASSDPTQIVVGLGHITQGISVALYSTMAGLAMSMWTHCSTLIVSNQLARKEAGCDEA